jgi:hypothetical protein
LLLLVVPPSSSEEGSTPPLTGMMILKAARPSLGRQRTSSPPGFVPGWSGWRVVGRH